MSERKPCVANHCLNDIDIASGIRLPKRDYFILSSIHFIFGYIFNNLFAPYSSCWLKTLIVCLSCSEKDILYKQWRYGFQMYRLFSKTMGV